MRTLFITIARISDTYCSVERTSDERSKVSRRPTLRFRAPRETATPKVVSIVASHRSRRSDGRLRSIGHARNVHARVPDGGKKRNELLCHCYERAFSVGVYKRLTSSDRSGSIYVAGRRTTGETRR